MAQISNIETLPKIMVLHWLLTWEIV